MLRNATAQIKLVVACLEVEMDLLRYVVVYRVPDYGNGHCYDWFREKSYVWH